MESVEAFSLILPPKVKQPRIVILLSDCFMLFREDDYNEIIDLWKTLDQYPCI